VDTYNKRYSILELNEEEIRMQQVPCTFRTGILSCGVETSQQVSRCPHPRHVHSGSNRERISKSVGLVDSGHDGDADPQSCSQIIRGSLRVRRREAGTNETAGSTGTPQPPLLDLLV
jgi:hypothetical protein